MPFPADPRVSVFRRRRAAALAAVAAAALVLGLIAGAGGSSTREPHPVRVGAVIVSASRSFGHRQATRGWRPYRRAVPVLMYHFIDRPRRTTPDPVLHVSPRRFRAQVRWLRRHGFRAVTLQQVGAAWRGRGRLPPRPIVLTFDDGYRSQYSVALPVLRRVGWPGVLNLLVSNMQIVGGIPYAHVRRMLEAGWELASHTLTHRNLRTLDGRALRQEVVESRHVLERLFNVPVLDFCYPGGRYDAAVVRMVRRAGYRLATTVASGLASPRTPLLLDRVHVDNTDTTRSLAGKLRRFGVRR